MTYEDWCKSTGYTMDTLKDAVRHLATPILDKFRPVAKAFVDCNSNSGLELIAEATIANWCEGGFHPEPLQLIATVGVCPAGESRRYACLVLEHEVQIPKELQRVAQLLENCEGGHYISDGIDATGGAAGAQWAGTL